MKLFELTIDDVLMDEVFAISLVEEPAIESNFMWFDKEKVLFERVDKEKRLVVGPVLIPNKKIFRVDGEGNGYEVFFKPETVEKLAQGYLKKGYQSKSTLEHKEKVDGVHLVESWIKTNKLDKSNSYGLNVPVGTWMGMFKIDNDEIWEDYVKNGEVKGFSIEGLFTHDLVKASSVSLDGILEQEATYLLNEIRAIIKKDKRYSDNKRVEMESYNDYPQGVKNNAKRGIELNKKINNRCATPVGKIRAQQLAQGKPISIETIKRMYSYLSRAEAQYRKNEGDNEACSVVSYLLWGGLAGLGWSRNKLREQGLLEAEVQPQIDSTYPGESDTIVTGSIDISEEIAKVQEQIDAKAVATYDGKPLYETKEEAEKVAIEIGCEGSHIHNISGKDLHMPCAKHSDITDKLLGGSGMDRREDLISPNPCQDGYIAIGTKIKDGREVPNCVEQK